jgi:hypothetical protein
MKPPTTLSLLSGVLLFGHVAFYAAGQETDQSRAATKIIQLLAASGTNMDAQLNLSPVDRVKWVIDKGTPWAEEKAVEKAQDVIKEAMGEYAKAAFRAKAFQDYAVPAFRSSVIAGAPFAWSDLDATMAHEVDIKLTGFNAAVSGAFIVWDAASAWSEGGMNKGFAALASGTGDAVAEAYIPGWAVFKLGAAGIEAVGSYIMAYANQDAAKEILNSMFSIRSEPNSFVLRLQNTTLANLNKFVDDNFDSVAPFMMFPNNASPDGYANEKQLCKDLLLSMRSEVAIQWYQTHLRDLELRSHMQPYLDAAAQAQSNLTAVSSNAVATAKPMVDAIHTFQREVAKIGEADAVAAAQSDEAEATADSRYTPIPHNQILPLYKSAYDLIPNEAGHWDAAAFQAALGVADTNASKVLSSYASSMDQDNGSWLHDLDALASEKEALSFEAQQRVADFVQGMNSQLADLAAGLRTAQAQLQDELQAINIDVTNTLIVPWIFSYVCFADPDYTLQDLQYVGYGVDLVHGTQRIISSYEATQAFIRNLQQDHDTYLSLVARHHAAYHKFLAVVAATDAQVRTLNPCVGMDSANASNVCSGCWSRVWVLDATTWCGDYFPDWALNGNFTSTPDLSVAYEWESCFSTNFFEMSLATATFFDIDLAISIVQTNLDAAEDIYNREVLTQRLWRGIDALMQELAPIPDPYPPDTSWDSPGLDLGAQMAGEVNGIVDYRQPIEKTDLARLITFSDGIWGAWRITNQVAMIERHPDLMDTNVLIANVFKYGQFISDLKTELALDLQRRINATNTAATRTARYQSTLDTCTPVKIGQTPDYYFQTMYDLQLYLVLAQTDLRAGLAYTDPAAMLMVAYLQAYIPKITQTFRDTQAEYTRQLQLQGQSPPTVKVGSGSLVGAVGLAMQVVTPVTVTNTGGSFSSPNLPAGLTLDAKTGAISGVPTQGGDFDLVVDYTSASRIIVASLVHIQITNPPPTPPSLTLSRVGGSPTLSVRATPGITLSIQSSDLGSNSWWGTLTTLPITQSTQTWTDPNPGSGTARFYRAVWIP